MANFLKSLFVKGVEIDTASATTGKVLTYDGTKFAPATPGSGSLALDDLSDVVITTPEEFQGLSYNGTNWVNSHQPLVSYVRNAESTTLTTGTCVYLFGATGDHASVKRADNNSDTTSAKTIGVAGANITASNNGPVVTRGYVDGIDLSTGYTAGDVLWLGESGAFTTTKPTAPDHLVFIGVVVRATNNGIIYVATQNGYELDELHNVSLPSPQSGEFLKYNGSLWVADAIDLGTDTTGNYMSGISGTSPVSVSHTPAEGSSATVALEASYGDTQNPYASKTANYVLAAPNGSSGAPTFRAIVAADIPTLNQDTTGTAANITAASNTSITSLANLATIGTLTTGSIPATLLTGTVASARISGSYTGITGVGTLSAGSIPASLLTGTIASARISGSYTGITGVGTLSAGSIPSSLLTGQTGMWTSAGRPGATRLYRNDSDDAYNVQTYWTGSRWRLYGYLNSTAHADTHVGYSDSSGTTGTATNLSGGSCSSTSVTSSGTIYSTRSVTTSYVDANVRAGSGGTAVSIALHASGVAPQFRVGASTDIVYLRNFQDTAYSSLYAIVSNQSSRALKQDISNWPVKPQSVGSAVNNLELVNSLDIVKQLRPVTYKWIHDDYMAQLPTSETRVKALERLNNARLEAGLDPWFGDDLIHKCGRDCDGSLESPCARYLDWDKGQIGFIAEEVAEVVPQAGRMDAEGNFSGLDGLSMSAIAIAAIKELEARVAALENK